MTPEDLVTIHEITQLKYRYMRCVDTQNWELMKTVFTKDARAWYSNGGLSANGGDNIVAALAASMKPTLYSSHIAVHPEITLTSPTTAKGSWRMEDIVHFIETNPAIITAGIQAGDRLIGAGYYYDEYEKVDGAWKISSTGYVRLFDATERQPTMVARYEKARGSVVK